MRGTASMRFINWFKRRLTIRGKTLRFYERGMSKAKRHDHDGAKEDYTNAINHADAPVDVVSMALFNRALVQIAAGEFTKGVDDLTAVLEMKGAPASVKNMAKQKLAKRNAHTRGKRTGDV